MESLISIVVIIRLPNVILRTHVRVTKRIRTFGAVRALNGWPGYAELQNCMCFDLEVKSAKLRHELQLAIYQSRIKMLGVLRTASN